MAEHIGHPIFDDYLIRLRLKGTGQAVQDNFAWAARTFLDFCEHEGLDPLTVSDLDEFRCFDGL